MKHSWWLKDQRIDPELFGNESCFTLLVFAIAALTLHRSYKKQREPRR